MECDGGATSFSAKNEPWLQHVQTSFGSGIRRTENERLILWVNLVAAGVVSARKLQFMLEQVTHHCHHNGRTCVAVVILPNRAGDLRSSPTKHLDKV